MKKIIEDYRAEHFTREEWLFYGFLFFIMAIAALLFPVILC
jgi:hypothetical protein